MPGSASRQRQTKEYLPRDAEGDVQQLHRGHYKYREPVCDHVERYLAAGKSVMFLATCSYMLEPLKAVLRARGLPFHNPYRIKRKDWNPMASVGRLLAYLRPREELAGCPWLAMSFGYGRRGCGRKVCWWMAPSF